ncbi:hypothetical protein GCM10009527_095280 [Actinomadura nitritigenes]
MVDPMCGCGIGTTLVEAIHLGRDAAGMEYERAFVDLTLNNLRHAQTQGATGRYQLACGDARAIATVHKDLQGEAALVLAPAGAPAHRGRETTRAASA